MKYYIFIKYIITENDIKNYLYIYKLINMKNKI